LERNASNVPMAQAEFDRFPKVRQILRRYRHRESHREVHFAATFDRALAGLAQIGSAKETLRFGLHSIELQIKLEPAVIEAATQLVRERAVVRDPDAVGVQEQVIDSRIRASPREQLEELRMQSRFPAGKLEDLDAALAINHALNAALQIRERDGIDVLARADG
jgi:hypothetical protein